MIYKNFKELVGNTPLFELNNIKEKYQLKNNLYAKLESYNPAGSVKDRIAVKMIDEALKDGLIDLNTTIIEPTSGNTGIGLAAYCASLKMKVIIIMPSSMSIERRQLIQAYGATIELTDPSLGMKGSVDRANELHNEIKNSFIPSQFENKNNPLAHKQTAKEIYEDLNGKIDILVSAIGTGGTISGVGKELKERIPSIKIVGVEPSNSPLLSKGYAGKHGIQGIGANFIPNTLDRTIYDEIITIDDDKAFEMMLEVARIEGISIGISSGAALCAGIKLSQKEENKNIVIIFPDGLNRYTSLLK